MLFTAQPDPNGRYKLRELQGRDLHQLIKMDHNLFYHQMRHVDRPAEFLIIARNAQLVEKRSLFRIGITNNITDELIGIVTLILMENDQAELGFFLDPAYQNQGITKDATIQVIQHLQPYLNLSKLIATADPDNAQSIKLLKKLGFIQVGGPRSTQYQGDSNNPSHHDKDGILLNRPRLDFECDITSLLERFLGATA